MSDPRAIRSLKRDEGGGAMVEFTILAPLFALLVMAVFEYGMFLFVGANLETAVREAARYGVTGAEPDGVARSDRILEIIEERTFGMIDTESAMIRVQSYPSFSAAAGGGGTDGAGGPGEVVVYEIEYPWSTLSSLFTPYLGGLTLSTSVAVRNEVF